MGDLPKMLDEVFKKHTTELANKDREIIEYVALLKTISSQLKDAKKYEIITGIIDKKLKEYER